jgi:hypothetical protein
VETRVLSERSATAKVWGRIDRWRETSSHSRPYEAAICVTRCFQFGDIIFQLETNEVLLIEELMHDYSECFRSSNEGSHLPHLRCSIQKQSNGLILLTVSQTDDLDLADIALGLLNPDRRFHEYVVTKETIPGWRLFGVEGDLLFQPFLLVRDVECIIDVEQLPQWFLVTYAVALAQAAQKHVLFLHAASVSMRGRGLLLIGESFSGKTTTSLTLACRGHVLLGDNIAAVRIQSHEILPFRRVARIREGPRASALDKMIERRNCKQERIGDGTFRIRLQASEFFPERTPDPVILGATFFLCGFGSHAKVERCAPEVHDLTMFRSSPVCWGASVGHRLMKLMTLKEIFLRVACHRLVVGPPEETAHLIESTLEEVWD